MSHLPGGDWAEVLAAGSNASGVFAVGPSGQRVDGALSGSGWGLVASTQPNFRTEVVDDKGQELGSTKPSAAGTTTTLAPGQTTATNPHPYLPPCQRRAQIYLTADPETVPADGNATSTITAVFSNRCSDISGVTFSFGTAGSSCGTLSSATATSGSDGKAPIEYEASTLPGNCDITVSANTLSAAIAVHQVAP